MSSTAYVMWFLAMAILIPVVVHGGITWAYFLGKRRASSRPSDDPSERYLHRRGNACGTDTSTAAAPPVPSTTDDDGSVPEKQILRWQDDGGVVGSRS